MGCDNGRDAIVIVKCYIEGLSEGCDSYDVLWVHQEDASADLYREKINRLIK